MDGAAIHELDVKAGVLVLEDDPLIAMNVEAVVREAGLEQVHVAGSQATALALAADKPLIGALLDVMLDGSETYVVADLLAARGVPFIFCTGLGPHDIVERHRHRPLLAKPYLDRQLQDWLAWISRLAAVPAE